MSTVSIVTPWINTPELIPEYEQSVRGAQVIVVDNGSAPENATPIRLMVERLGGIVIRNELNAGFAAANNQGLKQATGDIVMFLNSDISADAGFLDAVRRDVGDNVLAGPSMAYQPVYALMVPYLEGWCIAGRRGAWDRLGGWDAVNYSGPYWEDNDLCLRALSCGMNLTKTVWPIRHIGQRTIKTMGLMAGESFERNRQKFAARVRPIFEKVRAGQQAKPPTPPDAIKPIGQN